MKDDEHDDDRRLYERVPLQATVELFYEGEKLGAYAPVDVSEGGVQIRGFPLPALSRVKVFVQHESRDDALLVDGVVAWRTLQRSGIQFLDISAAAQEIIKHLVQAGHIAK